MKKYNSLMPILIAAIIAIAATSCKKAVLDETLTTARAMSYYATDEGIMSLATGTYYSVFAVPFNGVLQVRLIKRGAGIYAADLFQAGEDLIRRGIAVRTGTVIGELKLFTVIGYRLHHLFRGLFAFAGSGKDIAHYQPGIEVPRL